jgi:hypothetical protein
VSARLPEYRTYAGSARVIAPLRMEPSAPNADGAANSRQNWLLYLFLFLLPLQNLQTGYMPNLGGGFNFLNIGFGLALLGAWRCGGSVARWSSVQTWVFAYVAYSFLSLAIGYTNVHSDTQDHFGVLKDSTLAVMLMFLAQMSATDWRTLRGSSWSRCCRCPISCA